MFKFKYTPFLVGKIENTTQFGRNISNNLSASSAFVHVYNEADFDDFRKSTNNYLKTKPDEIVMGIIRENSVCIHVAELSCKPACQ